MSTRDFHAHSVLVCIFWKSVKAWDCYGINDSSRASFLEVFMERTSRMKSFIVAFVYITSVPILGKNS
jgi:hypothetical protein